MKTSKLLLMAFLALLVPHGAISQGYIDSSAYQKAVSSLQSAGIIDVAADVRLGDYLNRAEALKVILLAQNQYALEVEKMRGQLPPLSLFPDVDQNEWYAVYVETGFRNGLIKGYPDGRFVPEGGVKVVEAAAMLARSYREPTESAAYMSGNDLPNHMGQWYTGTVSVIHARSAVMPGSRLSAGNYMTRGQLFDMVYRMREVHSRGLASFGGMATATTPVGTTVSPAPAVAAVQTNPHLAQYASDKPFAITIPKIGIVGLTVTHPGDTGTQKGILAVLQNGVGHLFGYPGGGGKVMIYGHSSGYPWDLSQFTKIFRTINELAIGDRIYVTYEGKLYVYEVSERKTVTSDDKTAFEPDEHGEKLVLYTCWPPDSISQRLLVYAVPVETVALR